MEIESGILPYMRSDRKASLMYCAEKTALIVVGSQKDRLDVIAYATRQLPKRCHGAQIIIGKLTHDDGNVNVAVLGGCAAGIGAVEEYIRRVNDLSHRGSVISGDIQHFFLIH